MHLGQTASFLAHVFNRPEPTVKMLSRHLREAGWIKKGARGVNAPHTDSADLSAFLIAFLSCPDSPAIAMERLPHFHGLSLETDIEQSVTFGHAVATLLERIAGMSWERTKEESWSVSVAVDLSSATIAASPAENSDKKAEYHLFGSIVDGTDHLEFDDLLPYFGALKSTTTIDCLGLFHIAKAVLAGENDPLMDLTDKLEGAE